MKKHEELIIFFAEVAEEARDRVRNAKNLSDKQKERALIRSIEKALDRLNVAVDEVIPEELTKEYFKGVDKAGKLLKQEGTTVAGGLALNKDGSIAKGFQKKIHLEAVERITEDTLLDFRAAIRTAKRNASKTITDALDDVKGDIAKGLIVGDHNRVISQRVSKSFAENGLTSFTTIDGKRLPLDFYARTVTRTKVKGANTQGAVNRYTDNGVKTVKITGNYPTCSHCAAFRGMVISLDGGDTRFLNAESAGIELPPYHPNCHCSVIPYVTEYKTEEELEKAEAAAKTFNPNRDTRSKTQQKEYKKQQERNRQNNEEKKYYARMKSVLGEDAPKTLGAFKRMKRQNTENFQKIQGDYLGALHKMKGK